MGKIESGSMEFQFANLDMAELVENEIEANRGYADEYNITFKLTESIPEMNVYGDKDRIIQVLVNLLSNAAKFSPKGEKVDITITRMNSNVRVSVSDKGIGVPDEFQENVFGNSPRPTRLIPVPSAALVLASTSPRPSSINMAAALAS